MRTFKAVLFLIAIISIGGCGAKMNNYESLNQLVTEAQLGVAKVTPQDLKNIIDHNRDYKIIDCRESEEYSEGHIPAALNIPRGILEFSNKISNRRETIYIYSQENNRSAMAYNALKLLKYKKVYVLDGGWKDWSNTFPQLIELYDITDDMKHEPKVEETGGCGG